MELVNLIQARLQQTNRFISPDTYSLLSTLLIDISNLPYEDSITFIQTQIDTRRSILKGLTEDQIERFDFARKAAEEIETLSSLCLFSEDELLDKIYALKEEMDPADSRKPVKILNNLSKLYPHKFDKKMALELINYL